MLLYLKLAIAGAGLAALVGLYLWIASAFQERDDLRLAVGRLAAAAAHNAQVAADERAMSKVNLAAVHDVTEFLIVRYRDAAAAKERIAHAPPLPDSCAAAVGPILQPALEFLRNLPADP